MKIRERGVGTAQSAYARLSTQTREGARLAGRVKDLLKRRNHREQTGERENEKKQVKGNRLQSVGERPRSPRRPS